MAVTRSHPRYLVVWAWLLALMAAGLAASAAPGARGLAVAVIFGTAVAKALLIGLNFMHLRFEGPLIVAIATVPVLFAVVLTVALFPDFVFGR